MAWAETAPTSKPPSDSSHPCRHNSGQERCALLWTGKVLTHDILGISCRDAVSQRGTWKKANHRPGGGLRAPPQGAAAQQLCTVQHLHAQSHYQICYHFQGSNVFFQNFSVILKSRTMKYYPFPAWVVKRCLPASTGKQSDTIQKYAVSEKNVLLSEK